MGEKTRVAETPDTDPRENNRCACCDEAAGLTGTSRTVNGVSSRTDSNDGPQTVEVDADVSDAREAIEILQADVDALTEQLNEASERLASLSSAGDGVHTTPWPSREGLTDDTSDNSGLGDDDYGLPAPSPSDVQQRVSESNE